MRHQALRGRVQVLLGAALFSTGGAAIKATELSAWQVASLRSLVAAVTLMILLPGARRGWSRRAALVSLVHAGTFIGYVAANKLTTAASAIFLQSTAPLYLLLLAPWLLREPLRRRDLGFLAAMAAGLACFFVGVEPPSGTAPDPALGNVVGAATGLLWALTLLGLRWLARGGHADEAAAAVVMANWLAFALALPAALPLGRPSAVDLGVVLFLGSCQIGVAYVAVTAAVRVVPALEVSLLLLVEPVLNPLWAWLAHGEAPGRWAVAGGVVILAATAWRTLREAGAYRATAG